MPRLRKRRRENRSSVTSLRMRIDWIVYVGFTYRPDVGVNALRRAQDGPFETSLQFLGGAELAQEGRLVFVLRCLHRHECHEAARLRIVEGRKPILILGIHIDTVLGK